MSIHPYGYVLNHIRKPVPLSGLNLTHSTTKQRVKSAFLRYL